MSCIVTPLEFTKIISFLYILLTCWNHEIENINISLDVWQKSLVFLMIVNGIIGNHWFSICFSMISPWIYWKPLIFHWFFNDFLMLSLEIISFPEVFQLWYLKSLYFLCFSMVSKWSYWKSLIFLMFFNGIEVSNSKTL